ncbi:MAG: ABC transporter ATP-binding protein [Thermoproteota archaeon]
MTLNNTIIETLDLKKWYTISRGIIRRQKSYVKAVDGVSIRIEKGEAVSLVGESGSGKTTLGKLLLLLEEPTDGKILFEGNNIIHNNRKKEFRRKVQMIFQNPYTSFDPRLNMFENITEPLVVHNLVNSYKERFSIAINLLSKVGLNPPEVILSKYPHQLSGGQLQRASIARALSLNPELLVADEPTSMLDASLRIGVLNTLKSLQKEMKLSVLLITHDLAAASYLTSRVYVMYLGKIVECGDTQDIIDHPLHPYTIALMDAVLTTKIRNLGELKIKGELTPNYKDNVCRFSSRCPYANEKCLTQEPKLVELEKGHFVACHYPSY